MDFFELKDLYEYLEGQAGEYKHPHHIAGLFQNLRDKKHKEGKSDDTQKCQWEVDCFNFRIQEGKLKHMFVGINDDGKPFEYPSISNLVEKELDYIEERFESTSNTLLKARYAHILWESPKKHEKYAKVAVDAYLDLITFYEKKDQKEPQNHYGLDVLNSVERASYIGLGINYQVDAIRSESVRLVKSFNYKSSSAFVMRARLIRHMLEAGKVKFPINCFDGFSQVCVNLGKKLFKDGGFHNAIDIFEAGEKVDKKVGTDTHDWNRSIAESYEGLMRERDESYLAVSFFCRNAIDYYIKINDHQKVEELEKKYESFRSQQQFHEFSFEIDSSEYANKCQETAERLSDETPDRIIAVLIGDKTLIPTLKYMEQKAEDVNKSSVFSNIAPISVSDRKGNIVEHFTTEEEINYYRILEQYDIEIQTGRQILIDGIFLKAIEKEKLNIYTVMGFFERNSWYGKNIRKKLPNNQTVTYNWLNMIAPGLNDYFNQLQVYFLNKSYSPNFVLAMDSLILKIEGIVRDICYLSGITTFFQTKDKKGLGIVREKDINWLLREEAIKKLFNEDDLLFFKYVLVEKAGLNLRHKIAHCLVDYSEYNITYMHFLLMVLFKLGRYVL